MGRFNLPVKDHNTKHLHSIPNTPKNTSFSKKDHGNAIHIHIMIKSRDFERNLCQSRVESNPINRYMKILNNRLSVLQLYVQLVKGGV